MEGCRNTSSSHHSELPPPTKRPRDKSNLICKPWFCVGCEYMYGYSQDYEVLNGEVEIKCCSVPEGQVGKRQERERVANLFVQLQRFVEEEGLNLDLHPFRSNADGFCQFKGGGDIEMFVTSRTAEAVFTGSWHRRARIQGNGRAPHRTITPLVTDEVEQRLEFGFMTSGCGCVKDKGKPCLQQFSPDYMTSVRASCAERTQGELDMVIASVNISTTVLTAERHTEGECQKSYTAFTLTKASQYAPRCSGFCHWEQTTGEPCKKLEGKWPQSTSPWQCQEKTKQCPFLHVHWVCCMGSIRSCWTACSTPSGEDPGYSRSDLQLLPSSTLKQAASSSDHERQCASSLLTVTLVHEHPGRGMQPGATAVYSPLRRRNCVWYDKTSGSIDTGETNWQR